MISDRDEAGRIRREHGRSIHVRHGEVCRIILPRVKANLVRSVVQVRDRALHLNRQGYVGTRVR